MGNLKRGIGIHNIKKVVIAFFLILSAFLLVMRSPLNCISIGVSRTDSSVFRYVAFIMSKGGMPYKDAFDHKGPLLYLINYLGFMISYNHGVWYIEFVFMIIFLAAAYKTARLFCGCKASCFLIAVAVAPLESFYQGGNFTEEYAMPFLAIALYLFIDYFMDDIISTFRLVICGMCFAVVIMLRANMISVWVVFCIAVLVWNIGQNKGIPWKFLVWFLVGSMIVIVPIIVWLIHGKAFSHFLNDYILFNLKYSSYEKRANMHNKYNSIMEFLGCNLLLMSIVALVYMIKEKISVFFDISYLIYIVITLLLMTMSGSSYGHYGMVLVPLFIYPLSKAYSMIVSSKRGDHIAMLYSVLLLLVVFKSWKGNLDVFAEALDSRQKTAPLSEDEKVLLQIITESTSEDDPILVIGNKDIYYLESKRMASSRLSYQFPVVDVETKLLDEFTMSLVNEKPKIVIVSDYLSERYMNIFVTKDAYELLYVADDNVGIYRIRNTS